MFDKDILLNLSVSNKEQLLDALYLNLYNNPNWRRSPGRIKRHSDRLLVHLPYKSFAGLKVLDFGCGHRNPLAAALLMYVNGADVVYCIDIKTANSQLISMGLYFLLMSISINPSGFSVLSADELSSRLGRIKHERLLEGDYEAALKNVPIHYNVVRPDQKYRDIMPNGVDLVISQSVLEHVFQLQGVLDELYGVLNYGGHMAHYVDFTDHDWKSNRSDPLGRWRFLTTNDTRGAGHSNRIRLSEMVEILRNLDLDVVIHDKVIEEIPSELRDNLMMQYQTLSDDDLATLAATIVCNKAHV